jgi:hypothetical protein
VFGDTPAAGVSLRPEHERPPAPPPTERSAAPPPAPGFGYAQGAAMSATTVFEPWETLESGPTGPTRTPFWRRLTRGQLNAVALATGLIVGFVVVAVVLRHHTDDSSAAAPFVPAPVPSTAPTVPLAPTPQSSTPQSRDPDANVLQRLVVRQNDVVSPNSVQLLDGGNQVSGETTLDLCNGSYPSESLRTARLQVVEYDGTGSAVFSTEAVLYKTPQSAAQAMREVRSVAASCPSSPVTSPVGEPTVTTHFQAAPDKSWQAVPGVERAAYAFTTTDDFGETDQRIAVYVHRGRVLEGLYFDVPGGTQPSVNGQTTVSGIVRLFEQRIAALPASVVNG